MKNVFRNEMKRKLCFMLSVVAIFALVSISYVESSQVNLTELELSNVEALTGSNDGDGDPKFWQELLGIRYVPDQRITVEKDKVVQAANLLGRITVLGHKIGGLEARATYEVAYTWYNDCIEAKGAKCDQNKLGKIVDVLSTTKIVAE